jgi:hypothetical protein
MRVIGFRGRADGLHFYQAALDSCIITRLVVVGVNKANETAVVTTTTPPVSHTVSWSKPSVLDESQNALRVVREATKEWRIYLERAS